MKFRCCLDRTKPASVASTAAGVLTSSDAFARVVFLDLEKGASFKLSMASSTAIAPAGMLLTLGSRSFLPGRS